MKHPFFGTFSSAYVDKHYAADGLTSLSYNLGLNLLEAVHAMFTIVKNFAMPGEDTIIFTICSCEVDAKERTWQAYREGGRWFCEEI